MNGLGGERQEVGSLLSYGLELEVKALFAKEAWQDTGISHATLGAR